MKVAVVGCCHGKMSSLYASIAKTEKTYNVKVDLVIICGDFQSIRNETDLKCISCPDKYKVIGDFHKYYSGERLAPYMTIFIGGNHESSNYLSELYYGGWVCKNIYYLGYSGVVNFNGLRIAGISGIYKVNDFDMGQFEKVPYDNATVRSIYHIRKFNWSKLMQIEEPVDIMLSHDWPTGISFYGNYHDLLRRKEFFKQEMYNYQLGSIPNNDLLVHLKPSYWFSAHLHCKFAAVVNHDNLHHYFPTYLSENQPKFNIPPQNQINEMNNMNDEQQINKKIKIDNPDEIVIDDDDDDDNDKVIHENSSRNIKDNVNSTNPDEIIIEDSEDDDNDNGDVKEEKIKEEEKKELPTPNENVNTNKDKNENVNVNHENNKENMDDEENTINLNDLKRKIKDNENTDLNNSSVANKVTRFLALDKCLPGRQFMQIVDIPTKNETESKINSTEIKDEKTSDQEDSGIISYNECQLPFEYDIEWLAITRAFNKYPVFESNSINIPSISEMKNEIENEKKWIQEHLSEINLNIYENPFIQTAPYYPNNSDFDKSFENPQTKKFCEQIAINIPPF
ncbi:hypothetical protein BCR36DRAFT_356116 [Piromyces finnis]|uniref:Lariat debranching enzyme C-terminal domain-containing protein n=1 Tax=Piromyces finnis TaxID=1754191 RepID=A0A1Y1V4F0_9FUNG|nr:hypothetical protein BCR36DRAFT_356116 [Piromyces finnis]|eukprot:ORX47100.1 hypothetical protein BCR36DRAFT_356116 [Piromyces finnis]